MSRGWGQGWEVAERGEQAGQGQEGPGVEPCPALCLQLHPHCDHPRAWHLQPALPTPHDRGCTPLPTAFWVGKGEEKGGGEGSHPLAEAPPPSSVHHSQGPQSLAGPPEPPFISLALGCPMPRLESLEGEMDATLGCPALHILCPHPPHALS